MTYGLKLTLALLILCTFISVNVAIINAIMNRLEDIAARELRHNTELSLYNVANRWLARWLRDDWYGADTVSSISTIAMAGLLGQPVGFLR